MPCSAPPLPEWSSALRNEDLIGRWGGEEFVAVLPATTLPTAMKIGERLRVAIAATPIAMTDQKSTAITVSIGCAATALECADALIGRADKAMYQAKRSRDAVVAAADPPLPTRAFGGGPIDSRPPSASPA